ELPPLSLHDALPICFLCATVDSTAAAPARDGGRGGSMWALRRLPPHGRRGDEGSGQPTSWRRQQLLRRQDSGQELVESGKTELRSEEHTSELQSLAY